MPHTADPLPRDEVRRAGLAADGPLPRLLALLRAAPEPHLDVTEAQRLAAEGGLALGRAETTGLLEALAGGGLLGRVPTPGATALYDTAAHPHSHMIDEAQGIVVDLDVSPATLSAIIARAIADQPERVEVLLRIRPPAAPAPEGPRRRGRPPKLPPR